MKPLDFQEGYLRMIFGFVGIKDIDFVIAQPMDEGDEVREQRLLAACAAARVLGRVFPAVSGKQG